MRKDYLDRSIISHIKYSVRSPMGDSRIVENIDKEFSQFINTARKANEVADMGHRLLIISLIRQLHASRISQPSPRGDVIVDLVQQLADDVISPIFDEIKGTTIFTNNVKKRRKEKMDEVFRRFDIDNEAWNIIMNIEYTDIITFYLDCLKLGNEAAIFKWTTYITKPIRYTAKIIKEKEKDKN